MNCKECKNLDLCKPYLMRSETDLFKPRVYYFIPMGSPLACVDGTPFLNIAEDERYQKMNKFINDIKARLE